MRLIATFAAFFLVSGGAASAQQATGWDQVGPLFAARCVKCHSGFDAPMGLTLDTYKGSVAGSWSGAVVKPGDVAGSSLLRRLRGQDVPQMPLDGPPFLSEIEIAMVEAWVLAGLPDGSDPSAEPPVARARPAPGAPVRYGDIEPIFLKRCVKCHSDNSKLDGPPEGLRLGSAEQVLAGGERVVVVPGNPEMSELWRRVAGFGSPRMPFDGPPWLEDEDIRLIYDWIKQGAPDAEGRLADIPVGRELRLRGSMTAPDAIDGATFRIDGGTRIDDRPGVGAQAEMRGVVMPDGSVRATRLRDR